MLTYNDGMVPYSLPGLLRFTGSFRTMIYALWLTQSHGTHLLARSDSEYSLFGVLKTMV